MADDDKSQKTEEPTQKKLEDSHKKGEVAKSRDVGHWFMLFAMTMAVLISAPGAATRLRGSFVGFLDQADAIPVTGAQMMGIFGYLAYVVGTAFALPVIFLVAAAILGNLVQHRPVFSADRMKPKLSKISVLKGAQRMVSAINFFEFFKTVLKFVVVGGVVTLLVMPEISRLDQLMTQGPESLLPLVWSLTLRILGGVLAIMAVLAGLDLMFQIQQHRKKQRMSKQEIKDEYKQTDGDPHIKGRLRQIRMERSRKRMMAAVPDADVVITNPTHFAIALKYDPDAMEAPRVLAKGADLIAFRIRELAQEHNVPLVENPPLARTLYATVDVDQEIPPEHYKAVAEVISFVMRLNRERGGRSAPR